MRRTIIDRQIEAMLQSGLDAMISCSPENFAYTAGFVVPSQSLMRHRHAMTVLTADGRTVLFGVDMEESTIRAGNPEAPLKVWSEFSDDPMAVLADLLSELGLERSRIGIELRYIPAGDMAQLRKATPHAQFISNDDILARLRQVKTPEEIALLRRLSRISDQAITDALAAVKTSDSEMDIAAHLTHNVFMLGAQQFKLMIVATGERSQLPNVGPSMRRLETGDIARVETFSMIDGYHAGVCRTAFIGKAPPMAEEIWQILVDCKYLILDRIKPGASCREIYHAFINKLTAKNLPPISFVGHGIGVFLHEEPYLGTMPIIGRDDDAIIEVGNVFSFEPLCYRTGYGFGMQNKDMLVVTEDGCELLSDYANTDQLLAVP